MYEYLDRRYALALYKVGEEKGKVEEYIEDIKQIVSLIKDDNELGQVIKHPRISTSKKKDVFTKIFKGKIDDDLLSFLLILIEKDRMLYLEEKLKEMEKIHLERNNTLIAEIKTVIPLNEEEKVLITEKLQRKYNKNIILNLNIDKTVIGGVYVRVGNDVIDGSIRCKYEEMRKAILSENRGERLQ